MVLLFFITFFCCIMAILAWGTRIVPQQQAWVVQRLGKFHRLLEPGLSWVFPLTDIVAYRHSLKEEVLDVPEQMAITQDNVSVTFDGIVYIKIVDPVAASYGIKNPVLSVTQLVQTTMRSEIGKIPLDQAFEERESLNARLVDVINAAAKHWGIECLRYEIKDIKMPEDIRKAMEVQMTAERQKRARILESEGQRQAQMNLAEGALVERINQAKGQAESVQMLAEASARGIMTIAEALNQSGGDRAAALLIAEKQIDAFRQLAKEGTTLLLPSQFHEPAAMIASSMSLYQTISGKMLAAKVD